MDNNNYSPTSQHLRFAKKTRSFCQRCPNMFFA